MAETLRMAELRREVEQAKKAFGAAKATAHDLKQLAQDVGPGSATGAFASWQAAHLQHTAT